jgi:hypothetical protein
VFLAKINQQKNACSTVKLSYQESSKKGGCSRNLARSFKTPTAIWLFVCKLETKGLLA